MGEDDETPRPAGSPASPLQSETLISELSSRLIDLRAGEVDGAIQDALRRVRDLLEIDYAVLFQGPKMPSCPPTRIPSSSAEA